MSAVGELLEHLKKFEGFVPHPYHCQAGKLTIGYGHRIAAPIPDLTEEQGKALLMEDIEAYSKAALRLSPGLTDEPHRLNAVVDFCFNCGVTAYEHSTLRKMVDAKRWPDAVTQNNRWVYITNPTTKVKEKSEWQVKRRSATSQWLAEG